MVNVVYKNQVCVLCGKKKKYTSANSFHEAYCEKCLKLSRRDDADCLRDIKEARANDKQILKLNNQ